MQSSSVLETKAATVLNSNKILSDELLTAFHPLVRLPLPRWSQHVLDLLEANIGGNQDYSAISVCFNQTALLEFNFGRAERAFNLCYMHLEWLAELMLKTGRLELAGQAFDPWLNLGRLERLTGNYEASLERFELLSQIAAKNEIVLGPLTLTNDHWQAIVNARSDIEIFVRKACLTDILKTLLKSKQYEMTLEISEQLMLSNPDRNLYRLLSEAKFISLYRLEQKAKALELIETCYNSGTILNPDSSTGLLNLIFGLHKIEVLAISNNTREAQELAQELARQVQLFNYDKEPRLFKVALTLRLAKLLETLGLPELALPVTRQGYDANLTIEDEIFEAEFLKLLVNLDGASTETLKRQSKWQVRLEQLGQSTCYSELKKRLVPDTLPLNVTSYGSRCSAILDKLSSSLLSLGVYNSK